MEVAFRNTRCTVVDADLKLREKGSGRGGGGGFVLFVLPVFLPSVCVFYFYTK